jgi:broad-specificity NMP kinase
VVAEKSEFFFRALKHSVHQSVRRLGLVVVLPNVVLVSVSGLLADINEKDASFIIDVSAMRSQVDALVLLGVVQQDGLVSAVYDVLYQNDTIFEKQVHMILGLLAL